jgi:formylglycine-generating enzyme required for sulfatase activity/tRNA A-37 threonylcarbamoyl transferase component Bud32
MTQIGPYEVLGRLGEGGMGVVHKARAPDGRLVAVKCLRKKASRDVLARFDRERRLLAQLQEGFVPLLDAGEDKGSPYLVMPLLEGGTLRARLEDGPLGEEKTRSLGIALARTLGRAHALGIIHRDMKPENVLFDQAGRPFVADLGLAKHFEQGQEEALSVALSKTGELRGTAGYMPLEQMEGKPDLGPPTDVFALGAILHECLTGKPTFAGNALVEVFNKVRLGDTERIPGPLGRVIAQALSLEPAKRFSDGEAFARALQAKNSGSRRWLLAIPVLVLAAIVAALLPLGGAPAPPPTGPPPKGAPVAPPGHPRSPDQPDWYAALAADEKPPLPLPKNLAFGRGPGEYVSKKDGSVLVYVPAGTFLMGAADNDNVIPHQNEHPIHEVELDAYFIGKYELTNEKFAAFAEAKNFKTDGEKQGGANWRVPQQDGAPAIPDHPVVNVLWEEAAAYCRWAGLRLPTEAEWERAASWDGKTKAKFLYAWGDERPGPRSSRFANLADESLRRARPELAVEVFDGYEDGFAQTAPVGSFPLGASPVGALDMTGNVAEWCEDEFDTFMYAHSPRKNPVGRQDNGGHVARGGSWCQEAWRARTTYRNLPPNGIYTFYIGFRVAAN